MLHALKKIENTFVKFEVACVALILLTMCLLAFSQVVMRNISGLDYGWARGFSRFQFVWADVLVRVSVLWLAILGASIATTEKGHIHIDLLTRVLPEPYDEYLDASLSLFAAAACLFFALASYRFVSVEKEVGNLLNLLNTPEWVFATIFPVGFSVMAVKFVLRFFHDMDDIRHGKCEEDELMSAGGKVNEVGAEPEEQPAKGEGA